MRGHGACKSKYNCCGTYSGVPPGSAGSQKNVAELKSISFTVSSAPLHKHACHQQVKHAMQSGICVASVTLLIVLTTILWLLILSVSYSTLRMIETWTTETLKQ